MAGWGEFVGAGDRTQGLRHTKFALPPTPSCAQPQEGVERGCGFGKDLS